MPLLFKKSGSLRNCLGKLLFFERIGHINFEKIYRIPNLTGSQQSELFIDEDFTAVEGRTYKVELTTTVYIDNIGEEESKTTTETTVFFADTD